MIEISEILELAWQSLWRNKLRSALTMLAMIIGVSSVIMLISIGAGFQSYIAKQFEDLGSNLIYVMSGKIETGGYSGQLNLDAKDVSALNRIGYPIKDAIGEVEVLSTVKNRGEEKYTQITGLDDKGVKVLNFVVEKGRTISAGDVSKSSRVAVIGAKVATELYQTESPVGKSIMIQSSKYRIIGVMEKKGGGMGMSMDDVVIIPLTTFQSQFDQDKYTMLAATVYNKDDMEVAKKKIEEVMLKNHDKDEFTVAGQEELLGTINQILGILTAGLGGIAAISLLVGGIGIMNIMFVTVTERTKEIGLRKALGARPRDILIQFLIEAITLSFVGGSIGILLALAGSVAMSAFISSEVTPHAILLAFGFSSAIGIIFGVVPAWKAAKLDPIKALRYE